MTLSDRTFSCPQGKEVCLILIRDVTQLLFQLLPGPQSLTASGDQRFSCSGCSGLMKFARVECLPEPAIHSEIVTAQLDPALQEICAALEHSPFCQAIPVARRGEIFSSFQEVKVRKGALLIRQGDPNPNLYIVLHGKFAVELNAIALSHLEEGELFGEMSYLAADMAVSSVRACVDSVVLAISGKSFAELLADLAPVQAFMARLLATRLQELNAARARDFNSCMSGRLDGVAPAELFQVFHMHQKTGVLSMDLQRGNARVSFREGCIINAHYDGQEHESAIFAILAEKKGFYRFTTGLSPQEMKSAEIGDFMMLLMEGVKRIDESFTEQ